MVNPTHKFFQSKSSSQKELQQTCGKPNASQCNKPSIASPKIIIYGSYKPSSVMVVFFFNDSQGFPLCQKPGALSISDQLDGKDLSLNLEAGTVKWGTWVTSGVS